jgi:predicted extracellular nuclease
MKKSAIFATVLLLGFLSGGCSAAPSLTDSSTLAVGPRIVISEVLAGVEGNNQYEFIELYNADSTVLDLKGWSLWYRLPTSEESLAVMVWQELALIPPHGHYLLGQVGQDLIIAPDATFTQALNTSGGGLELRSPDDTRADALGWGKAPITFTEGDPAVALLNGQSLQRLPGGADGSAVDTDDNAADFRLQPVPAPENTGSLVTPRGLDLVTVEISGPLSVRPGEDFLYMLTVVNPTEEIVERVVVELPLPSTIEVISLPTDLQWIGGRVTWEIAEIQPGEELVAQIEVKAPWSYMTILINNYYVAVTSKGYIRFGGPFRTPIEGGSLPINVARGMVGESVIVEGTATMYTGGFYAGSSGAKFYMEDGTGGVQVYVTGGAGEVEVPIGARVRVEGEVALYRGAVEIVPAIPQDVEVIAPPSEGSSPAPVVVSLLQAVNDPETLPGRLIQVEGTATRIEEFSYSYEMDIVDEGGQLLSLYIDKLTEMLVEPLEVGRRYRATGILEVRDALLIMNPRLQADITEVFPPVLLVELEAPSAVKSADSFTLTLTASNHTQDPLTDLHLWLSTPSDGVQIDAVLDGGTVEGENIVWSVPRLEGGGANVRVRLQLTASTRGKLTFEGYGATAAEWPEPATGPGVWVFVDTGVPIWAIQGSGFQSAYKLKQVTTSGVVTGIFPDLDGLWIQETTTDDDPTTSAALFVAYPEDVTLEVEIGDMLDVSGQVRELSEQTLLQAQDPSDVQVLSGGNALPSPIVLDPPSDSEEATVYYEALEGILVTVPGPALAVSPTTKYGEYSLILPYHGVDRLWREDPAGMLITVDDGSEIVHYDRSALPYVVATGDEVSGLEGPLAFTYGRYKIEPTSDPTVVSHGGELPALTSTGTDEFSIMTWNVEDLFDILDPHPTDLPMLRRSAYELDLTKVANTILAAGAPTIVGLQEVENIGILEDLAALDALEVFVYEAYLIEGTDSRGIDVGYLVRSDMAAVTEVLALPAPEGLTSRPPLQVRVEVHSTAGPKVVYVLNNHFTSMSGGELATEPRRTAQATWNAKLVEDILAVEQEACIAVIGDLNSYYDSPPIQTLLATGMHHVFEDLPEAERYTYNYQGISQTLDHIIVSSSLRALLGRVEVLRVDSDYPPPLAGDPSPEHASDHDPVVATFSLAP